MTDPFTAAIRAQSASLRANALTIMCDYCGASVGEECANRKTNAVLVKQPAHMRRLQDSGVA